MKLVINACFGGFGLSKKAMLRYGELSGTPMYHYLYDWNNDKLTRSDEESFMSSAYFTKPDLKKWKGNEESNINACDFKRNDPILVQIIEELGGEANRELAELKVVEIPDDIDWVISEYDGMESVEEAHRSWS